MIINDSITEQWKINLVKEYAQLGFFWTTIVIETLPDIIRFNIKENQPAAVKQINYKGVNSFTETELSHIITKPKIFTNASLQSHINKIINWYEDNGFPFASITVSDLILDDKEKMISYTLLIEENQKVYLTDFLFTNTFIKNDRLKQIYRLYPKQLYSKSKIEQKLASLNAYYAKPVQYKVLDIDSNYILQVDLAKMKTSTIQGILNYLPEIRKLNGYFYFTHNNFLNSLRTIQFAFEKYAFYTNFRLIFSDPYLSNFATEAGINHITYDTVYAKTNFHLSLKLPISDFFSANFLLHYEQLTSGMQTLSSNSTWWFGQGIKLKNIRYQSRIPKGYSLELIPKIGSRKTNEKNTYLSLNELSLTNQLPIRNKIGLSLDIILKNIYCKGELTIADSLRLGGIKNLRGHNENEFATNQYLLLKNEMKYYTDNTIFLLFDDIALLNVHQKLTVKNGYGVGLHIGSKIGTVGIEYGVGGSSNILHGKIHISFYNQFQ